jgi:hypothetical protein
MRAPLDPVFFSTFPYTGCKLHGVEWPKRLEHEFAHLDESVWPGFRTLGQLRRVCESAVYVDGSTYITRARSVATKHFLDSGRDVWVSVDDDVFVEEDVLRRQVLVCRATRGGVALPYTNRDGKTMTFRKVAGPTQWISVPGSLGPFAVPSLPVRTVDRVGMGCVALHRDLIERLAKDAPHFRERDRPNGVEDCPALFLEGVQEGSWVGEDYHFSALCERAGSPLLVLLEAPCEHQGIGAMLDEDGKILIRGEPAAKKLDAAFREQDRLAASGPLTEPCSADETLGG